GWVADVELRHVAARAGARVGDRDARDRHVAAPARLEQLHVVVAKRAVRQAEAERERGRQAVRVVPAVADEETLLVIDVGDPGILRDVTGSWQIRLAGGERGRQPAAWIDVSEEHARGRGSSLLARVPRLEQALDAVSPRREDGVAG